MANETTKPTTQVALDSFDFIRIVALFIIFLASFFREKKSWAVTDAVVAGSFGLISICAPFVALKQQVLESPDEFSQLLVRVFGAMWFFLAVSVWHTWRKSRDDVVISSLVYARFISVGVLLLVCGFYLKAFRPEHTYFVTFGFVLWGVASGIHLVRYANPLGGSVKRGLPNILLRFEFLWNLVLGLAHLAFPEYVFSLIKVSLVSDMHLFWARAIGGPLIFFALMCLYATSFRNERDRDELFLNRFCAGIFFMALNYVYYYKGSLPKDTLLAAQCGHTVGLIPSAIGLAYTYNLFNRASSMLRFRSGSQPTSYNTRSKLR